MSNQTVNLQQALDKSKTYLVSDAALQSIERDPYWPKWDTPWWHMRLLQELGLAHEIPKVAVTKMVEVLQRHYLPIFPIRAEEIPAGTDLHRQVACHCAVGGIYQVLFHAGVDVDTELPWMRPWMLRYQLPDGGLNCDEKVYTKPAPKSSIVSTINCLEAILFCARTALTAPEIQFLQKGADYLLAQKLFRKVSDGQVIDPDWLEIRFPRFYDYDFLRGYYFLAKWSVFAAKPLPVELVHEVHAMVASQLSAGSIVLKRYNIVDRRSYNPSPGGAWGMGAASEFDLLKAVSGEGMLCPVLTKQWNEVKDVGRVIS